MQTKNNLVRKVMSGVSGLALLVGLEGCGHNIVAHSYTPPSAYSTNDLPSGSEIKNYLTRILPSECNSIYLDHPNNTALSCIAKKCIKKVGSGYRTDCEQKGISTGRYGDGGPLVTRCSQVPTYSRYTCTQEMDYTKWELSREKKCLGVSAEINIRDDNKFENAIITVNYLVEPSNVFVSSSAENARSLADFVSKYYCNRN